MPYTNPNWHDNTSPAINATNLGAISSAIVSIEAAITALQSDVTDADTAIGLLQTAVTALTPQISTVSAPSALTVADNYTYVLTGVTSCTLSYPAGNFHTYIRFTTASSGTVTSAIVFPAATKYVGDIPTYTVSTTYDCDIMCVGGVAVAIIGEVTSGT